MSTVFCKKIKKISDGTETGVGRPDAAGKAGSLILGGAVQRVHHGMENMAEEEDTKEQGHHFRDGEGPPDQFQPAGQGEQPGGGEEHHQLTDDGHHHAQKSIAQRLEGGGGDHTEAGHKEAQADDTQSGNADLQHIVGSLEETQDGRGEELDHDQPHHHDGHGKDDADAHRVFEPLCFPRAVVVGHDGHHAVVEAEDRHKDEALYLNVDAQYGRGGGGKGDEDLVHAEGHHRADGVHDNGGDAHGVDLTDDMAVGAEMAERGLDVMVHPGVEIDRQNGGHDLSDDGGGGGAGYPHFGEGTDAEDEDRVQNNIDDGAQSLGEHGLDGPSGGLEETLHGDFQEDAEGKGGADGEVDGARLNDDAAVGLEGEVDPGDGKAQHQEDQIAQSGQKEGVFGGAVGHIEILFAQTAGEQGVDADGGTHCHGDHQVLIGEGQRDSGQGVLADLGHKDTVHYIVKGLDEHGDHDGQRHGEDQSSDGHCPHFVFGDRL